MLTGKKHARIRRFVEIFVTLWKQQKALGVKNPKVGRQAALLAGYGGKSWSELKRWQAADCMFSRLTKRDDVLQLIREQGLERNGRLWREV